MEGPPTSLMSTAKQDGEEEEEATTTDRMDYTWSDFHVVHCNLNYVFGLS